jgi:hypothetical protein
MVPKIIRLNLYIYWDLQGYQYREFGQKVETDHLQISKMTTSNISGDAEPSI